MQRILIIFFLLFSSSAFTEETVINCIYEDINIQKKYKKNLNGLYKSFADYFLPFNFEIEFINESKREWKINKQFSSQIENKLNNMIDVFVKHPDNYSVDDIKVINFFSILLGVKKTKMIEEIKETLEIYSKEELTKIYSDEYYRVLNDSFYNVISDELMKVLPSKEIDEDPNKIALNNLTGEPLGNNVILEWTTDNATLIRIKMQYPDVIEKYETNSSLKIINFEGETYIDTEGFCYNKKITQTIKTTTSNNNDKTINKLKKLKLMFDEELITQEEYDAKRKDILDEM